MEQWLLKKGAVPVSKKIKKEAWYKEVSKLPPCLKPSGMDEDPSDYNTGKKEARTKLKKLKNQLNQQKLFFQLSNAVLLVPFHLLLFTFHGHEAMSETVIRVENLSKLYRLGEQHKKDSLTQQKKEDH